MPPLPISRSTRYRPARAVLRLASVSTAFREDVGNYGRCKAQSRPSVIISNPRRALHFHAWSFSSPRVNRLQPRID